MAKQISLEIAKATADAIKDAFVPKDEKIAQFEFCFTIPPNHNFKASYYKTKDGWQLGSCEAQA